METKSEDPSEMKEVELSSDAVLSCASRCADLDELRNEDNLEQSEKELLISLHTDTDAPEVGSPVKVSLFQDENSDLMNTEQKPIITSMAEPTATTTEDVKSIELKETTGVSDVDIAAGEGTEDILDVTRTNHQEACENVLRQQQVQYQEQLEQLKAALIQKDSMITLYKRENTILEKEKQAFRKEKDLANKEKESAVIKFAMKEKLLLDAKKEKEMVEKQLLEARREIKNCTTRFHALQEERSRVTYLMDEKCNEIRKYQRESEKHKSDYGHLESRLKYQMNKLNMETEAKLALEKKLEEERNAPHKLEEKAYEKLKIEFEAQTILLKHEIERKGEQLDKLIKDTQIQKEHIKNLQEQLAKEIQEKNQLSERFVALQEEHNDIQNSYSEEMLSSAKLRGQLEELQILQTQNALKEEKINTLNRELKEILQKVHDNEHDLKQLHEREKELLAINKEMSESIVALQNQICLLKSETQGIAAENELLKREQSQYDEKYLRLESQLKSEQNQKNEERLLLAKHLSEKTKLYEVAKLKLDNVLGDFEATKHKHGTVIKELQREIQKCKKSLEQSEHHHKSCQCNGYHQEEAEHLAEVEVVESRRPHSRQSSSASAVSSSRRGSQSSESDTVMGNRDIEFKDPTKTPSKKHLVERILRLQQASARQAEKIDFLENHTLSLVAELQKKSKVVQYYMLRDQTGALTSSKSDQNKSELVKYGNGVMSAIYNGIKGADSKSMTLELSLEINKKLQAVLEDTLLKNITLKENLDVLGLEVDNLTRKLRQTAAKDV
uniref:Coiled-coil domain-containing protein 186 n=1 Tax=Glossina morsitans morsitans TaxID=37546 RepID=A0A1B0GAS3_GLOMM